MMMKSFVWPIYEYNWWYVSFFRAPHWHKGGTVHGPRKYTSKFYMLPYNKRLMGLTSTLSAKLIQVEKNFILLLDIYLFLFHLCLFFLINAKELLYGVRVPPNRRKLCRRVDLVDEV